MPSSQSFKFITVARVFHNSQSQRSATAHARLFPVKESHVNASTMSDDAIIASAEEHTIEKFTGSLSLLASSDTCILLRRSLVSHPLVCVPQPATKYLCRGNHR